MNALREQLTCATCGAGFERRATRGPNAVYCTPACRSRAHYQRARADGRYDEWLRAQSAKYQPVRHACTCVVCGSEFSARTASAKYCQPICSHRAFGARRKADGRLAEQRRKRAPQRAAYQAAYRVAVPCGACGAPTTQAKGRKERPTCGSQCKTYFVAGQKWPTSPVPDLHPSRSTHIPDTHPARCSSCAHCGKSFTIRGAGQTYCREACASRAGVLRRREGLPRFVSGWCRRCGDVFVADRMACSNLRDTTCSPRCTRALCKMNRDARMRANEWEPVSPIVVFDRDGWRCHLCGDPLARGKAVPHPHAPTMDHVIPVKAGGGHLYSNLRAAHFECNWRKRDRLDVPSVFEIQPSGGADAWTAPEAL